MVSRSLHLIVGLAATLLVLTGCGGSGPALGSATEPIGGEEFGLTFGELAERSDGVEQAVGECMADAGFEYVPVDFDQVRRAMTSDKSAPGMSSGEFISTFGFGISTQPSKPIVELSLGPDNEAILKALSPSDQVAYLRSLYGTNTDATFAFALELEDLSRTGGCTRTAIEEFFTPEEMLSTYHNPVDSRIEQDPRVQVAIEAFEACMFDKGFEFAHPDQVEDGLWEQLDAIVGSSSIEELSASEQLALEQLQTFELSVAPAAATCEGSTFDPVADIVEREVHGN